MDLELTSVAIPILLTFGVMFLALFALLGLYLKSEQGRREEMRKNDLLKSEQEWLRLFVIDEYAMRRALERLANNILDQMSSAGVGKSITEAEVLVRIAQEHTDSRIKRALTQFNETSQLFRKLGYRPPKLEEVFREILNPPQAPYLKP